MTRLLVVGGINMDYVFEAPCLPRHGETLGGQSFRRAPGGKGADQAVAATRLGAETWLVGCAGDDAEGRELLAHLRAEGVRTDHVAMTSEAPTGAAAVFACRGESAVTVVPGANHRLTAAHVRAAEPLFAQSDVVLAELGIPSSAAMEAAELAHRFGKPFLLTPSPAGAVPPELARRVHLFLANQHELRAAFGDGDGDRNGDGGDGNVEGGDDWRALLARWPGRIVVTRGSEGAAHVDAHGTLHEQPAFHVPVLDTTGAGDAFAAALAVHWSLGIPEAMRRACAVAALAVRGFGSQSTLPTRQELSDFLETAG
ncbi:ribokinase [Variovorax boronicumulans]|uniref:ribokinase n=1 Tax=Variovorax boronicumulans TaxID=436515 RepID=UPI0027825D28|nr:ribokinase [Variovorax boronicumulans]MDQ0070872.1 ribokinase [Variovorax boronicumulans]